MKKKCMALLLVISLVLLMQTKTAYAYDPDYYGSGNYASSAPYTPISGLRFYADYYAINEFDSGLLTAGFDWNGDYQANVAAIAQYPAPASAYPNYFTITVENMLLRSTYGNTLFYDSNGNLINAQTNNPMNASGIYRCQINLNVASSFPNNVEKRRTIVHETGHVFLLVHPADSYISSVMHQGHVGDLPNHNVTATVTDNDKRNLKIKWGR